jgi:hypothetical protein
MKFITHIAGGRLGLYLDKDGNVGLNTSNTNSPEPWYNLGNWKFFKKEVERALDEQRQSLLSSFSLDDLEKEVSERRIKIKSDI